MMKTVELISEFVTFMVYFTNEEDSCGFVPLITGILKFYVIKK